MSLNIYCNNCGIKGHYYKNCRFPVTSFGNLIFRTDGVTPKILMIERKDSLCYIEIIRGKYDLHNNQYIQILIDKCSIKEKEKLLNNDFKKLWCELWLIDENEIDDNNLKKDYLKGFNKFNILKNKLHEYINVSKTSYNSSEWEIPKGRRNLKEKDIDCAIREFNEETNYTIDDYKLIKNLDSISEEFVGENNVKYKFIYYIGKLINLEKEVYIDKNNKDQYTELKDIQWLTKDECKNKLRDYHKSRLKLIEEIFEFIDKFNDLNLIDIK
jgi:8-oxo-dGTP pyrophosphatase MutT (NUDIX family)